MIKSGDKVHVEFIVDRVEGNNITIYRECFSHDRGITKGYRINHDIDYSHPAIVKCWTPVHEPQVGDQYHFNTLNFQYEVVYVEGTFAVLKKHGNLGYNVMVRSFEALNDEARFLLV